MSAIKRLAAGQFANFASLGVYILSQLFTVPVINRHWGKTGLGAWLTIQAVVSLLSCPDWGLQDYVWIRAFQLGPKRTRTISRLLGASMRVGVLFGLGEFIVALIVVGFGWHVHLLGLANPQGRYLTYGSGVALLTMTATSSVFGSVGSYINRVGQAVGLYAAVTWWTAAVYFTTAFAPTVVIWRGASMSEAAVVQLIAVFVVCSVQVAYLLHKFKLQGIIPEKSHQPLPMLIFRRARLGYTKNIFEQARQQGVRVLLALLTTAADVAVFATTRTIANIVLQAGLTLSNPIMPELASLVRERKAVHVAGAFSLIWVLMSLVIAPGAFVLQVIGGTLFNKWISGTMPFDPWLLGTMILGVVVSFGAFPSYAMVRSQNDFVALTRAMIIAAFALIGTMLALVPKFGALGGGIGLLAAEVALYVVITLDARRWVAKLNLNWPTHSLRLSQMSLALSALTLFALAYWRGHSFPILAAGIIAQVLMARFLFHDLPESLKVRLLTKLKLRRP